MAHWLFSKRLGVLLLALTSSGLSQVVVKVKTNKTAYLVGEPVFVIVEVKNVGIEAVGYSYCDGQVDLTVEGTEKKQPSNLWGCGAFVAGGSACGIDHPPLMVPGQSVLFYYLLRDDKLGAGNYVLRGRERLAPVPRVRIPPSPPHSLGCREIRLHSSQDCEKSPQFYGSLLETGPEKIVLLNAVGRL